MDLLDALLETEVFAGFRRLDLEPLTPSLRTRRYQPGAYLWHAGEAVSWFGLVTSGLVKARHMETDGSELLVQLGAPGDTIGEFHVFDDQARRYYDVVAVEATEVIVVPRDHLAYLLEKNARLTVKLAAAMMRRLLRLHGSITDLQLVDLETRLARRLLELADTAGKPVANGTRITVRISQSLLASSARASRENTNRALNRLAARGVIALDNGYLVIRDRAALHRHAQL
jgi:CRP-like cAMP-binding protein